MTLDQLSNLIKDPKLFGILIVRPFGLLLQWQCTASCRTTVSPLSCSRCW